jgi:hypothetical protein
MNNLELVFNTCPSTKVSNQVIVGPKHLFVNFWSLKINFGDYMK